MSVSVHGRRDRHNAERRERADHRFSHQPQRGRPTTWLRKSAAKLSDEIPGAYKPIDQVMKDQSDLVEVVHELRS